MVDHHQVTVEQSVVAAGPGRLDHRWRSVRGGSPGFQVASAPVAQQRLRHTGLLPVRPADVSRPALPGHR